MRFYLTRTLLVTEARELAALAPELEEDLAAEGVAVALVINRQIRIKQATQPLQVKQIKELRAAMRRKKNSLDLRCERSSMRFGGPIRSSPPSLKLPWAF